MLGRRWPSISAVLPSLATGWRLQLVHPDVSRRCRRSGRLIISNRSDRRRAWSWLLVVLRHEGLPPVTGGPVDRPGPATETWRSRRQLARFRGTISFHLRTDRPAKPRSPKSGMHRFPKPKRWSLVHGDARSTRRRACSRWTSPPTAAHREDQRRHSTRSTFHLDRGRSVTFDMGHDHLSPQQPRSPAEGRATTARARSPEAGGVVQLHLQ